jgi:hypothetical protein
LITIVSPRTFARWASGESSSGKPRKPGCPRKPEEIRQLIAQMAEGTGWGSRRETSRCSSTNIPRRPAARATAWDFVDLIMQIVHVQGPP